MSRHFYAGQEQGHVTFYFVAISLYFVFEQEVVSGQVVACPE